MVIAHQEPHNATDSTTFDRASELKAFDDTKGGIKGLIDAGITQVPRIFIRPKTPHDLPEAPPSSGVIIPVIDLARALGADPVLRKEVVAEICAAAETYGIFQVVNHSIPAAVSEEMLAGTRRFFEQDLEAKKEYYSRDLSKSVVYNNSLYLHTSPAANWKDTLYCRMTPTPSADDIPLACRDILLEYSKESAKLGFLLLELLSEALDLPPNYLKDLDCGEEHTIICHYSPPCPEPEKAITTDRHHDKCFITVLLQDDVGCLQVLHDDMWFDLRLVPGTLIVNVGEFLQIVSNDKFKSIEHRVLANRGLRTSVASFFSGNRLKENSRLYGPIKELVSETNPAKYRETTLRDFYLNALDKGHARSLPSLRI